MEKTKNHANNLKRLSDRKFGLAMSVASCVLTGAIWLFWGRFVVTILYVGAGFLVFALIAPGLLLPINRVWHRLSQYLFQVTNYTLLAVAYFCLLVPVGLVLRLVRSDYLMLRKKEVSESCFRPVETNSGAESLRNLY